jgi:hypothetical protein
MSFMLFRAGKSLIVGESKNKEGHVWHLELCCELTEAGPVPLQPEMVRVAEAMIVNPSYDIFLNPVTESTTYSRRFRDIIHENVVPFIATGREVDLGGRTVVAYERDRRGLALREGSNVVWSAMNEVLAELSLAEVMALEGVRGKLVEAGLLDPDYRGRVSSSFKMVTEDKPIYMKINPFRDKSLLREGTEVSPVGYYAGCVTLEADGEDFWAPVEEAEYYSEERKSEMWYFKQVDGNSQIPDPLAALPSKVALRTTAKDRRRSSLQWDPKADMRKVVGHLQADKEIGNNHSVMGESFAGTFLHHFWYPQRYNAGALRGSDMRTHEPALNRDKDKRDKHGNKNLAQHTKAEVPPDFKYTGDDKDPQIDDGTGAHPTVESVEHLVNSILRGTSVTAIFAERLNPEKEKELRKEHLQKLYPGSQKLISPALSSSQVGP